MKKPTNWIDQRLTILTEIRNDDPARSWTARETADAMKNHELVKKFQPNYSKSTAHRDIVAIDDQLIEKREELAVSYILFHLEVTDDLIADLVEEYHNVKTGDHTLMFEDRTDVVKAKVNLTKAIIAAQKRQADVLPIDMPKKITVAAEGGFDIEHFYQIREQAKKQIMLDDPTMVEGEFA